MIFLDHMVKRCYVTNETWSTEDMIFVSEHRTELNCGDNPQIVHMSAQLVLMLDRSDHPSDWLGSLKCNFNLNTRVRQNAI